MRRSPPPKIATRERYGELIEKHIIPNIGAVELQKLDGPQIDIFYATLGNSGRRDGNGGLSPQTVRHIHRLLSLILASAVKAKKLTASPMAGVQTTPKVRRPDIQVLDDAEMAKLASHLKGALALRPGLCWQLPPECAAAKCSHSDGKRLIWTRRR